MGIKVVVDSTSYIPEDIVKSYDISVVPLSVVFESGEVYKESSITNKEFYEKLEAADEIPKSSQPSVEELYETFEKIIKSGEEIIGVFISSEMSGTYSTANMVKDMILKDYPEASIKLIDSRSNCMQLGFAAITAAKAAKEGKKIDEVVSLVEKNIVKSRFIFTPDTLDYLKKGGRIGAASALLGSFLNIKPILTVTDGKTDVITKIRGKKKTVNKIVDIFVQDVKEYGFGDAIIHHINCEQEAKELADKIKKIIGETLPICSIGPVIGAHVGPGSLGVAYFTKKNWD
ncbi:DegV family protein [Proteinivorax hydrogeniformans]|uniref:DegV family protein n=1 Tax=Proteinivorax hydrogeniformans TaxID=1826727 RepID=A0AAU8HUR0_9FIRM